MHEGQPPEEVRIPLVWSGVEELPTVFVNMIVSQFEQDVFIITLGEAVNPALIGTPEEIAEQVREIAFVPVRPIVRLALTRPKLMEFIATLQANLDQYDRAANLRPGDPR